MHGTCWDIWLAYMRSVVGDTIDLRIRPKEVEHWYYDSRGESAILAADQLSQIGMHHCANSGEGRAILSPSFFFSSASSLLFPPFLYLSVPVYSAASRESLFPGTRHFRTDSELAIIIRTTVNFLPWKSACRLRLMIFFFYNSRRCTR